MRREGFEFAVSKAEVLYKYDERNRKLEPMEIAYVDVPDDFTGAVIQKLTSRKGELQGMSRSAADTQDWSSRFRPEVSSATAASS